VENMPKYWIFCSLSFNRSFKKNKLDSLRGNKVGAVMVVKEAEGAGKVSKIENLIIKTLLLKSFFDILILLFGIVLVVYFSIKYILKKFIIVIVMIIV